MTINVLSKPSRDNTKVWYYLEWGRSAGQRRSTGIFTYIKPKSQTEKNHNKEALAILEIKKSQIILDNQAVSTGYIPSHKVKINFLDYYEEFVRQHRTSGNRHLEGSFTIFKRFIGKDFISATEINETVCERFRTYLLKNYKEKHRQAIFYDLKE